MGVFNSKWHLNRNIRMPRMVRLVCFVMFCLIFCISSIIFIRQYTPTPAPAKLIDLRKNKSVHDYSIILTGAEGKVGHAFVSWHYHPQNYSTPISEGIGFYAVFDGTHYKLFSGTQGEFKDEFKNSNPGVLLTAVIWVDEGDFYRSKEVMKKWQAKEEYVLLSKDCITFVEDIAKSLNIKTPRRFLAPLPITYVRTIMEIN